MYYFILILTIFFLIYRVPYAAPFLKGDLLFIIYLAAQRSNLNLSFDLSFDLLVFAPVFLILFKLKFVLLKKHLFLQLNQLAKNTVQANKIFYIILIIYYIMIFSKTNLSNPREFYNFLIEDNRSGGYYFSIIAMLAVLVSAYCYSLRNVILTIIPTIFIGAKGFFINIIITYFVYQLIQGKLFGKKNLLILIISIPGVLYIFELYASGIDSVLEYYLYDYLDHLQTFYSVHQSVPIFPSPQHIVPWFNDLIPGISKITGLKKNDLHEELFPNEMAEGKAPGMLIYELYFRGGLVLFPILYFVELLYMFFLLKISISFKSSEIVRYTYIAGAYRYMFVILMILKFLSAVFIKYQRKSDKISNLVSGVR